MPARWREDFDAGRQRVRAALDNRAPPPRRSAGREEPVFNTVLYRDDLPASAPAGAGGDAAAMAAEIENLRALLGELSQVAEAAVAHNTALEQQIAETGPRAALMTEVLELPGVRRMLFKMAHPDANPNADEAERRARTEATSKINMAYELIDRAKAQAA